MGTLGVKFVGSQEHLQAVGTVVGTIGASYEQGILIYK